MKEAVIKKKCRDELEAQGWWCWVPVNARFAQVDIWGVFDIAAWKGNKMRFIQYTSISNISARIKKVTEAIEENNVKIPSSVSVEVWGLRPSKEWRKEKITTKTQ